MFASCAAQTATLDVYKRQLQLTAFLRTGMDGVNISRMLVTAWENGQERPVDSEFYEKHKNPFRMAVNGEHMVYILSLIHISYVRHVLSEDGYRTYIRAGVNSL